jgi:hypothetical protein
VRRLRRGRLARARQLVARVAHRCGMEWSLAAWEWSEIENGLELGVWSV